MAKSRGRKFAELLAPTNGVFAASSLPTISLSKLANSTFSVNSESASLGGNVVLDSNDITEHTSAKYFTNARAQATLSVASNSGHGALAYDNSNGQFTFAGITTEAIQDVVGAQLATNGSHTGVSISYDDAGDGAIDLTVNDTTKLPLAGGTMTGNLTLGDNVSAYFGASTDLRIYHDGTNSHIINSTNQLRLTGSDIAIKSDSAKLLLGASDDLQIYHDGSNSYIKDYGTGRLHILSATDFLIANTGNTQNYIYAVESGAVTLYHSGSAKLATTSGGVTVTGGLTATALAVNSGGSTSDLSGTAIFRIMGGDVRITNAAGSEAMATFAADGAATLYHDSSAKLATASTGVAITGLATMATGTASSKFAVGTASVHGSYAFYNDSNSYFNGAVTVDDTLSANKLVSLDGVLELDDNGTHNGIINSPASLRINIDSDNGNSGESFAVGHNQTAINANNKLFEVNDSGQVTINNAFTFPTSDGSANQILQTNGSGTLSWVTNSGGSSQWTASGSDIYYNSGNVGIGKSSGLTYLLELEGAIGDGTPMIRGTITGTPANGFNWATEFISANLAAGRRVVHVFGRARSSGAAGHISYYESTVDDNNNQVQLGMYGANDILNVTYDRKVGINTSTPASILHIEGNTNGYNTSPLLYFGSTSTANAGVRDWAIGPADSAYGNFHIFRGASTGASPIGNAGTVLTIDNAGQVGLGGLGYFAPAAPLHVNSATDQKILLSGSADPYIRWQEGSTNKAYIQWNAAGYLQVGNQEDGSHLKLDSALIVTPSGDEAIVLQGRNDPYIRWQEQTTNKAYIQWNAAGYLQIGNQEDNSSIRLKDALDFTQDGSTYHSIWHAGNDGSGSGLDADLLDGNHASAFLDTSSTYQRKGNGLQLGSASALTNSSSQLSLAGSNPYISFHHGSGARTAYFQEASSRFYLGECTYTETEGSFRAPVFYDVNNTSYYTDQANVSRLNNIRPDIVSTPGSGTATMFVFGKNTGSTDHINFSGSSADPANVTNTVGLSWGTRSDGNGYYLIGVHNYNNTYSTHSRLRIGWHTGLELGGNPSYGGVRIFEDSPFVNGTEQARFRGSSGIVFSRTFTDTVDIRTPIYYDSANTSYYLDIASSGTALKMSGSINMDTTNWTGEIPGKIQYHGNHWYFQSTNGSFHFRNSSGANGFYGDTAFNVFSTASFRAPIFYDTANTGYYCDPAGTSNLNAVTTNSTLAINSTAQMADNQAFVQEGYFRTSTSGQNTNGSANAYSFGYQVAGAWSHPYPDLILGFHTGVRIGGHKNYHGTRFYNDHPDKGASPTEIFSVGKSDDHIRATNNIYAYTSDKRLKENFRPIENAVDKVKALGGFIFDWRKDMMDKHSFAPDQEKDDAGLIAQEVQKVMPAAIRRAPFDYDPDKPNHSKSGEEFMTVQYEKMVPLLIEAIKEQQEEIDQLKKLLEEKE